MEVRPLDIAVVSTNNPTDYSGGRYHGLMLAFAAAAGGAHVRYLTDRRPVFLADLAGLAPGRVGIEIVEDWRSDLADGPLDYVVVVPTGVFHPAFYAAALGLAAGSGARLVLVNFESADWFNVSSPVPRDPALWQSWRGVVAEGGLVLSSARVSHDRARSFYRAPAGRLRFEIWSPPINAPAARAADGMAKARRVVTFLRSIDPHKGGADLLRLDPAALGGRRLDIVSGGSRRGSSRAVRPGGFRPPRLPRPAGRRSEVPPARRRRCPGVPLAFRRIRLSAGRGRLRRYRDRRL
jgi:hypothetical protein